MGSSTILQSSFTLYTYRQPVVLTKVVIPSTSFLSTVSIFLSGYAWSGGGRKIVRVDVSSDGGRTWQAADTLESDSSRHPRAWGWTLWTTEVPVGKGAKSGSEVELCVKAVDSQYNTQPESFANIWNLRGVLANAYHRVHVKLEY